MSLSGLLNPGKAFLALAAALAGYCLFRFYANTAGNLLIVPYLLAAGVFLSMADSAWQCIFAAAARSEETAGGLSTLVSFLIAVFITLAGLMFAMTGGFNTFRAGSAMVLLMLIRHALFRKTAILSPVLGGLSGGMILVIGMTAHPAFLEMPQVREVRVPAAFFVIFLIIARILAQAGEHAIRKATPVNMPASTGPVPARDPEIRISRSVIWLGGAATFLIPLLQGLIMPWRWLSWLPLCLLLLSLAGKFVPLFVYRGKRDMEAFAGAIQRGAAILATAGMLSLGEYRLREIYEGWSMSLPGGEELAAAFLIAALTVPAWLFSRPGTDGI
ncbi:MAG: hypothetical protein LBE84_06540 [Planctomycetota bacterium]|nr:hypothetical protein [Planctomycetota bacterium]